MFKEAIEDFLKLWKNLKTNYEKRSQKTQEFLNELSRSVQICTDLLCQTIVSGNNENRGTWAHPQVAINIAQWISPKFDVLVSKWVQPKSSADLLQLQQKNF